MLFSDNTQKDLSSPNEKMPPPHSRKHTSAHMVPRGLHAPEKNWIKMFEQSDQSSLKNMMFLLVKKGCIRESDLSAELANALLHGIAPTLSLGILTALWNRWNERKPVEHVFSWIRKAIFNAGYVPDAPPTPRPHTPLPVVCAPAKPSPAAEPEGAGPEAPIHTWWGTVQLDEREDQREHIKSPRPFSNYVLFPAVTDSVFVGIF